MVIVLTTVIQCTDRSWHFATFSITRCIRCQEAWDPDWSVLGSDLPYCIVCITQYY